VISSGSGQLSPATSKRLTVARTVEAAIPTRRAISRSGTSPTNFRRRISRTWRIVVLSAGIHPSLGNPKERTGVGQQRHPARAISSRNRGRDYFGTVGGIISERWADSFRNRGRLHSGMLEGSNRSRVTDLAASSARDLFEAGLNEAACC